ncbi:hypothetical protein [Vibrio algarum]|uniref:Glycosyltransferase n=1 Tax=Vibrio algarum TaxID=3020714 RepID=A0ABT4YQ79_9VIBR|nr:hypothetical protein [Vibrio sp. KJ40-1]MDB1123714.1 hypothetical protein [Vibrio sp. KJ40-1]
MGDNKHKVQGDTHYNSAILVILYNKEIKESKTLSTLADCQFDWGNDKLVIWNNGPKLLGNRTDALSFNFSLEVEVVETIENRSLSSIYNSFIANNCSERYVLLDDDTAIAPSYLNSINKVNFESGGVPIIAHGGIRQEPVINGKVFRGEPFESVTSMVTITGIGSGLVLGAGLLKTIEKKYKTVFDERFILYGVDATFFHRVNAMYLADRFDVLPILNHSLSRLENESNEVTTFRVIERANAHALILKFYKSPYMAWKTALLYSFKYFVKRVFRIEDDLHQKHFIRAFLKGKHYRDKR